MFPTHVCTRPDPEYIVYAWKAFLSPRSPVSNLGRFPSYIRVLFFLAKIETKQEYNEMQHLRIMESLGGDTRWSDRFLARHAAIVYFSVLTLVSQVFYSLTKYENKRERFFSFCSSLLFCVSARRV